MTTILIDNSLSQRDFTENIFHDNGFEVAASVGFFDGVHLGHRFLIDQLKQLGREKGLPTAVITFPVHPRKVLDARFCPQLLNDFEEKLVHLASTGVDYCFVIDFTPALSQLSAQQFIQEILYKKLHVRALLVGYDHRLGKDRSEDAGAYKKYGAQIGMDVIEAHPLHADGEHISSTEIRHLLQSGDVKKASELLSYPYSLTGTVVAGNQIGRKIGFPTANIQVIDAEKVIPETGIYAVWVSIGSNRYKGMLYIGFRPTIAELHEIRIEVNLLDFEGDLYQQMLTCTFVDRLRDDQRFATLEELRKQLLIDEEMAYASLAKTPG